MLANDIKRKTDEVRATLPWFDQLNEPRQAVLIGMAFQLGSKGLFAFTTTLSMVRVGRYVDAGEAMLDSRWAQQTPERAQRMVNQMESGEWCVI